MLYKIRVFLVLAEELHFWRTASKLNMTQSSLTRHIQALESDLDVKLFDRNKRNVKLTPAGRFLKEKWAAELSKLDDIHQSAKQIELGEVGTLKIAYPDSIAGSVLPKVVKDIIAKYPLLKIELTALTFDSQLDSLLNHKVDLIITRDKNDHSDIIDRELYEEDMGIVVPNNHTLKNIDDLSHETLAQQRLIVTPNDIGSSHNKLIRDILAYYKLNPPAYIYCEFGSTILSLIREYVGISIMPFSYFYQPNVDLRFIAIPFKTKLYLQFRRDDPNPILDNAIRIICNNVGTEQL